MESTDVVRSPHPLVLAVDVGGQAVATVRVTRGNDEHIVWDGLQKTSITKSILLMQNLDIFTKIYISYDARVFICNLLLHQMFCRQ